MNADSRDAVVLALVELARSLDYHDRLDAGDALVNFVDDPRARRVLLEELAAGDVGRAEDAPAHRARRGAQSIDIVMLAGWAALVGWVLLRH